MNLIWRESTWWLLCSGVRKVPRTLITLVGKPMRPRWGNHYDVAHLQAKTVPMNMILSESDRLLQSSSIRKISGALITPMAMPMWPLWANDHGIAHLQAKTVPRKLIWNEETQWLLSYGVCKVWTGWMDKQTDELMDETDEWLETTP